MQQFKRRLKLIKRYSYTTSPQWQIFSASTWKQDQNSPAHGTSKYWWQGAYWHGRDHDNPCKLYRSLFLTLQMTPALLQYHINVHISWLVTFPVNTQQNIKKYCIFL